MTLSSLFNDSPALTISYNALSPRNNCSFAWSDMPVVGDFHQFSERPMERSYDMLGKENFLCTSPFEVSMADSSSEEPAPKQHHHKRGHTKLISFSRYLEIREYALTIGDHPLCRDSLPLSLGWEHGETKVKDLNNFEEQRLPLRRIGSDMKLTYYERKNMLRKIAGMTEADIRECWRMHQLLSSSSNLGCTGKMHQSLSSCRDLGCFADL